MAHESFEDAATAELMNRLFVNIKIDREERPDLDRIYQLAHQLYTGRGGGWPLTVFLTPDDHLPIFAGTYFPKERRYGMASFKEVLVGIADYAQKNSAEILERGRSLVAALDSMTAPVEAFDDTLDASPIEAARARLVASFDPRNGGFGGAPKFPHATSLDLLIDIARRKDRRGEPDDEAASMASFTLKRMADGGLYDHLGGGFFRYCVDADWSIPHFEKMLYDNAALLATYIDAHAATRDPRLARVALETADWVLRDMQADDGAFFATLDADSAGEEGKFYVWTPAEIESALEADESRVFIAHYGVDGPPNFEGHYWHLCRAQSLESVAGLLGMTHARAAELLETARKKLLELRRERIWPGRDEKRLVAWNGLMIGALAKAARHLGRPDYAEAATRAADFIRERMFVDGRLFATYKDGRARFCAYLDDYACLARGLLELLQARWRGEDLTFAIELVEAALAHFADSAGGFFFTADDHEKLLHRAKPLMDESVPSGNAVMALVLQTLGHALGDSRYLDKARATVQSALPRLEHAPEAHATMLEALQNELAPPEIVIVRGTPSELATWQVAIDDVHAAGRVSFFIPADTDDLPGLLAERRPRSTAVAYYCEGTTCRAPITELDGLVSALD